MNITVIGTGYVGLVTGVCLAETGNKVICVDIDEEKVNQLKNEVLPIYEPGLENLFRRNIKEERLFFTTSLEEGIKDTQIVFLALPTPPDEDGSADLSYILNVSEKIAPLLKQYTIVITKSTVPVGTADKVESIFKQKCRTEYDIVSNPEFLREGVAVEDFMKPERIVIGTKSARAEKILKELYGPYVRQGNPVLFMDVRSAELTKYAANSFLATKISFMNEIANICERVGANVDEIRKGMGTDSRIGKKFLYSGIGYGGSCFPKDVLALSKSAEENNYHFNILSSVIKVNQKQKQILFDKVKTYYKNNIRGKTFAVWGAAFKPETDDIREAPSIEIICRLLEEGAQVNLYDPVALNNMKKMFGEKINYCQNSYEALKEADALLVLTEWPEFRNPNFGTIKEQLKAPIIFDGRNIYSLEKMQELGFYYDSIGRKQMN